MKRRGERNWTERGRKEERKVNWRGIKKRECVVGGRES